MRKIFFLLIVLAACETDPVIYMPSEPIPIIYAVFDDHDTTHYILVTKSFGAQKSPADFGFIRDSLYWDQLEIEVGLKEEHSRSWITIIPEKVIANQKDSGFFLYPYQEYYAFNRVISPSSLNLPKNHSIDSISIRVSIPGHPDAYCAHKFIDTIRIVSPRYAQQYLFLSPTSPMLFNWDWFGRESVPDTTIIPHAWNEIDVSFEFIEEMENETRSQWVNIQNYLYEESIRVWYRQLNITYEEFIREVLLQIKDDPAVIRRKLGIIKMYISGGDTPMRSYMEFFFGESDYSQHSWSNFQNAYGVLASSTHYYKDSMRFDYETRQTLSNDNRMKKLRLSPWSEE